MIDGHSFSELFDLLKPVVAARASVLVRGHPGVGKSALAAALAIELGLPMRDIRLAQSDPTDLCGVSFPNTERRVLSLLAPDWVHEVCERPHLLFLDEINAAVTQLHQAAAYQIVLEQRVGRFLFHPDTVIVAAGNLDDDRALVSPLSSALANRFVHFTLRVDVADWCAWAETAHVLPEIVAYIRSNDAPALYHNSGEMAFPSPRSWTLASRVCAAANDVRHDLLAACVGLQAADAFAQHRALSLNVDASAIIRRGERVDFRNGTFRDPSRVYATVDAVGSYILTSRIDGSDLAHIVRFLRSPGLDPEYAFLLLKRIADSRKAELLVRLRRQPDFRDLAAELVAPHLEDES